MKIDNIPITPEDAAVIRKLDEQRTANAAFVEQMRAAGERRNADLIAQGRDIWLALGTKYDLDLAHVQYDLTPKGDALRVMAAQFNG